MRLRHKLLLVNATVAAIAAAVFWLAYAGTRTVLDEYLNIAKHNLPIVAALQDLRAAAAGMVASGDELMLFSTLGAASREALAAEEGEQRGRAAAFADAAARYIDLVERSFFEEEKDTARDIDRKARELLEVSEAFAALVAEGRDTAGMLEARQRLEAVEEGLLERVAGALAHESEELAEFSERTEGAILRSGRLVALAAAVMLLLTGAGYVVARTIVSPINRLTRATARVAAGEAVELEPPRSRDELGELVAAFRKMASDLAAARGRAEAAGQAKTDFLAAMSHEIRTPMTGVLGMTDLLAAEELVGRQRDYVEAIRTSGRHLLAIVNDVLDFSRIEAGRLELERIDFSIPELLERVRSLMAPQARERGLDFEFELAEHSPPIAVGDPTRLQQVLLNLAGNGLKFTHKGGVRVTVSHHPEGERRVRFRFEVRDTGIGIPEEKRAGLFEAFIQADRSTARRYGGSGLGLAICKRLVEAMGGTIGVDSVPDVGSRFWFEVPLEVGDAMAVRERRAAFDAASVPPLRILLAEDVELNRDLLGAMLGRHGHEVVFATNGEEAVGLAARERFDLVLMDVQMPMMDGVEATRRIRRMEGPAGAMPILALTANVMAKERERYLAAGMDDALTKPVDWGELFAALARHGGAGAARAEAAAGDVAREERREPSPEAETRDALLLDQAVIDKLRARLPAEAFANFLRRGIETAERACGQLRTLPAGSEELARAGHSLKGTSGTFGLRQVSILAGEIEAAALEGREVSDLVEQLTMAVAATRAELCEMKLRPR